MQKETNAHKKIVILQALRRRVCVAGLCGCYCNYKGNILGLAHLKLPLETFHVMWPNQIVYEDRVVALSRGPLSDEENMFNLSMNNTDAKQRTGPSTVINCSKKQYEESTWIDIQISQRWKLYQSCGTIWGGKCHYSWGVEGIVEFSRRPIDANA